jgi:carbonic anhydrase
MTTSAQQLVKGFKRFRARHFMMDNALYKDLAERGQSPKTLIVSCCDSRVDPALVLDCSPGDLFVIRNVANVVPPADTGNTGHHGTSAALEFGVCNLKVENIVVLGHAQCGGIRALVEDGICKHGSFIPDWMRLVESARNEVIEAIPDAPLEEKRRECELRAIKVSLRNLLTYPWILENVEKGTLTLHGWYFDFAAGQLLHYDAGTDKFTPF